MTISDIIQNIKSSESYKNQIVHIEDIPLKEPEYGSIEIKPLVNFALDQVGIKQLYTHQVEAIKQIRNGKDIVLVTSTASGKSIAYMVPIFESVIDNPKITALYIAPLNALVDESHYYRGVMGVTWRMCSEDLIVFVNTMDRIRSIFAVQLLLGIRANTQAL